MDPIDLKIYKIKCILKSKKFILLEIDSIQSIKFRLENIYIPFGVENYNDKYIVNLEFEKTINMHNNYISILQNLEKHISNKKFESEINVDACMINKNLCSSIKESKLGYILRAHLTNNTNIFISKKDGGKIELDKSNLKGVTANIELGLKGIWVNDESYGFYWNLHSIQIVKFS
jgi:hypothetical protein